MPFGNKKKREEEERLAAEAAAKLALEEEEEAKRRRRLVVVRAGWKRYVLVAVVLSLAVYNVGMFVANNEKSQ